MLFNGMREICTTLIGKTVPTASSLTPKKHAGAERNEYEIKCWPTGFHVMTNPFTPLLICTGETGVCFGCDPHCDLQGPDMSWKQRWSRLDTPSFGRFSNVPKSCPPTPPPPATSPPVDALICRPDAPLLASAAHPLAAGCAHTYSTHVRFNLRPKDVCVRVCNSDIKGSPSPGTPRSCISAAARQTAISHGPNL